MREVLDHAQWRTIGEVSASTGLTAHTLRWYERIGLLDPVDRSHSGQRRYSEADLARLAFLGRLRLTGMPVADMLRYVELAREGDHTELERRDILVAQREEVRQRIADLHATLAVLDHKIDVYASHVAAAAGPAGVPAAVASGTTAPGPAARTRTQPDTTVTDRKQKSA
ncbi:MerR family transcriptional regulator [Kitasatospora sp. NE20-6]|uniref:MerR family transcriptional regulator n=1 Tax=Kitasatospora sp. NE20-6 TaxID=2859066 RepID=UPI0038B32DCA